MTPKISLEQIKDIDSFIKSTICILDLFRSKSDIANFNNLMIKCEAEILSSLSHFNSKLSVLLSNIFEVQQELYISPLKADIEAISESSAYNTLIPRIRNTLSSLASQLSETARMVESSLNLVPGSIDVYGENSAEILAGIKQRENTNLNFLLIRSGRDLLKKNSALIESFLDEKNKMEDSKLSLMNTLIIKPDMLYNKITNHIEKTNNFIDDIYMASTSAVFAIMLYEQKGFASRDDVKHFINRDFYSVKQEMLSIL